MMLKSLQAGDAEAGPQEDDHPRREGRDDRDRGYPCGTGQRGTGGTSGQHAADDRPVHGREDTAGRSAFTTGIRTGPCTEKGLYIIERDICHQTLCHQTLCQACQAQMSLC